MFLEEDYSNGSRTESIQFRKGSECMNDKHKKSSDSNKDKADRRAGPHQGPYVNNGKLPRARNDDGAWRKKRSDAGKSRSK